MNKTRLFWVYGLLLVTASVQCGYVKAQADSSEEYSEDFYAKESYEDSLRRAGVNAFDTLVPLVDSLVNSRKLNDNYIDQLKNSSAFSYVKNGIPGAEPEKKRTPVFNTNNLWLYIAIIAFIIFLAWYLTNNHILLFRKSPRKLYEQEGEQEKDIFSINYAMAINNAVAEQDYRLAVRLHYLQLLKKLAEEKIIQYQADKTNFDYLAQLGPTPYYKAFFDITRYYEYSWYGLFPLEQDQYNLIRDAFLNFDQTKGS